MTITVSLNGSPVTGIVWTGESRWQQDPIYVYHEIKGATHGRIYAQGKNSRKATISGRCLRTPVNESMLNSLEGSTVTIVSTRSGTHSAYVTGIASNDSNPAWFYFQMSVMEV